MMQADSCIPGIKMTDVMDAAPVLLDEAHRMRDPTFQRRVLYWKTLSGADLKSACQTNRCPTTGNKSVLSLRLALKDLPAVVPAPTPKAAGKRKADGEASAEPKPKAPKTPKPPNELASLKSSKAALAKADADDLAVIKTADLKKSLNAHVKSLAATVNADWHDSYEETAEEACVVRKGGQGGRGGSARRRRGRRTRSVPRGAQARRRHLEQHQRHPLPQRRRRRCLQCRHEHRCRPWWRGVR